MDMFVPSSLIEQKHLRVSSPNNKYYVISEETQAISNILRNNHKRKLPRRRGNDIDYLSS